MKNKLIAFSVIVLGVLSFGLIAFGQTIPQIQQWNPVGGFLIPKTSNVGTSTTIYFGSGANLTGITPPVSTSSAVTAFNFPFWTSTGGALSGTSTLVASGTRVLINNIPIITSTSTVTGDMLWYDGTGWVEVPPNTESSTLKFLSQFNSAQPHWQTTPVAGSFVEYFQEASSTGLSAYKNMGEPTSTILNTSYASLITATTTLLTWLTASSSPGLATLPLGTWVLHIDANRTAGNKDVRLYADVFRYDSGVETLLFTTQLSELVTGTDVNNPQELDIQYSSPVVNVSSTSRLGVRWYASISGGGSAPTVAIYYQGTTDSRMELPASSIVVNNFVPYTGATKNTDIGTFSLAAGNLLAGTSTNIVGGLFVVATTSNIFTINNSGNVMVATTTPFNTNAIFTAGKLYVMNNGRVGISTTTNTASFTIYPSAASEVPLRLKAYSEQTGNLVNIIDSNNTSLVDITSGGSIDSMSNINTPYGGIGTYQNLLAFSEQLDSGAWSPVTCTVSGDSVLAPNGTTTADRVTAVSGSPTIKQNIFISATGTYTFSSWVKANTVGAFNFLVGNLTSGLNATTYWQRLSATFTVTATGTTAVGFGIQSLTYLDVWGTQLEQSPSRNVYIKTTGGTVNTANLGIVANGISNVFNGDLSLYGKTGIGISTPITELDILGTLNGSIYPVPPAPVLGATVSGGSITGGTHSWKVTYVTALGETAPSAKSNTINISTKRTVPVAVSIGPVGTTQRKIYRTVAGDTGDWKLLTTLSDNTTVTFNDTIADGSLTDSAPTADSGTAQLPISVGGTQRMTLMNNGNVGVGTTQPSSTFHINGNFQLSASSSVTTVSIGGTALLAGGCSTATSSIDTSVTSSTAAFVTTPTLDVGDGYWWNTILSSPGVIKTRICAAVAGTPASSTYVVKIIK